MAAAADANGRSGGRLSSAVLLAVIVACQVAAVSCAHDAPSGGPTPCQSACAAGPIISEGSSCQSSPDCCETGTTCYRKNQWWSGCLASCSAGMIDDWDGLPWECAVESTCEVDGSSNGSGGPTPCQSCAAGPISEGSSCQSSPGCCETGTTCYRKNQWWSGCLASCSAGMIDDWDGLPWECAVESSTNACAGSSSGSPDSSGLPSGSSVPQIFADMRTILLSKSAELDAMMYVNWNPSTPQMYNTKDFVDALAAVYHLPYTTDDFLFELGGERSGRANLKHALAHVAAILGQATQESLSSAICDEVNWGADQNTFSGRPGCGQRGKGYSWPTGGESYGYGMFYCLTGYDAHKTWSAGCPAADPPSAGYIEGAAPFPGSSPMVCGTQGTEDCCWWGRGLLQLTGQCNYGMFQQWYGSKLGMDVCGDPSQICSSSFPSAKYWTAFGAWTGSVVNNYDNFDFTTELINWGNAGYPKSHKFVNGIGGLLNMGSAWTTAHGNAERQQYTQDFLQVIRPSEHSKTY